MFHSSFSEFVFVASFYAAPVRRRNNEDGLVYRLRCVLSRERFVRWCSVFEICSYKRDIAQLKLSTICLYLQQNNTLIARFVMTSSVFVNDETPQEGCGRWIGECYTNSLICRGCFCFKSVCIWACSHILGAKCDPDGRHSSSVKTCE
jgi:hypothetical protein